ncbi:MAG TPA: hypothetical protein VNQ76_05470 [Planctomicrobium sp.]|nr:hypothetical protein [Planctomicrobium sp.]
MSKHPQSPATDRANCTFQRLGFTVEHTPGVSRAWRYDFTDRSYLLVTDVEGYDLPEPGGPYSATWLSARNELLEFIPELLQTKDLYRILRRGQRGTANSTALFREDPESPTTHNM